MNQNPYGELQEEPPHEIEIPVTKPQQQDSVQVSQQPKERPKKLKKKVKVEKESSSSDSDDGGNHDDLKLLHKKKRSSSKRGNQKSIQLQQLELEEDNKRALQWAIRLRSCARIIFLIIITSLLITGFYIIFEFYAFFDGMQKISDNSNIFLNISNCRVNIFDSIFNPNKTVQTAIKSQQGQSLLWQEEHHGLKNVTSKIIVTPNMILSYTIPGRFDIDPTQETSEMETIVNGSNYTFNFKNILSAQSCEIDLAIYKKTAINNLDIHCAETCFMMIGATNVTFNSVNITGDLVEVNAPYVVSKNFSFKAINGRFQGGYLSFDEYADIRLDSGDIIVQSDKEMMVNWTHSNPHYCFGSPVVANPIVVGCQAPPASEIEAYISGVGTGKNSTKSKVKKSKNGTEAEKGKEEKKEKGKEPSNGEFIWVEDEEETEAGDDLYNELDEFEQFFDDQEEAGQVVLIPFLDTYQQSKYFQEQLGDVQELEEKAEQNKTTNTTKSNMHSKTKEKKIKQQLLFQPSCFGNSIFCQSTNCTSIKEALAKNNESITVANKTSGSHQTQNYRLLFIHEEEDTNAKGDTKNVTADNKNKTKNETKVDYKGLNEQAQLLLPHKIPKGVRFLNVTGRFGNVYVNVVGKPNATIGMKDTVIHGLSYASGAVEFDLPSQKLLSHYLTLAQDPHNFDPNFVLEIGSKKTRSDNFQQWQVTYNPAYSYVRPWWIGTFSFTLMSTASWDLQLNLGPGFCPYMPTLNLNDIYTTQFLVGKHFKSADHGITTIAWQDSIPFPDALYDTESNGVRDTVTSNDEFERWYHVDKLNETVYQVSRINLDESQPTKWAVVVSVLISILMYFFVNNTHKQSMKAERGGANTNNQQKSLAGLKFKTISKSLVTFF